MRRRHRRRLICAIAVLCHAAWSETVRLAATTGGAARTPPPRPRRRRKVFGLRPVLALQDNSSSAPLVPAADHERHLPEVVWSTHVGALEDLLPLAVESMHARLRHRGSIRSAETDAERMKAALLSLTQEELNSVDPLWQVFILDPSDRGVGAYPYWYMTRELAPLLGWRRINYATRATQDRRNMNLAMARAMEEADPGLLFDEFLGRPVNFTVMDADGSGGGLLGRGCRSVQRLSMVVREDVVDAIDSYMKGNHPSTYEEAVDGAARIDDARFRLSEAIAQLPRQMDVRTFWNATVCNIQCFFRNGISEIVSSLPSRHPDIKIRTNTDVVGFIHNQGRGKVHPDFVEAMMTTKIIVLAQRDHWEGHSRLYEALLSGALVMSDPQVYWPHGTVDGENIVVYHSWVDLEMKLLHYLDPKNEEKRMSIGRRGRETALAHHRSWTQAERLFLNDMGYRNEYGLSNKPWF